LVVQTLKEDLAQRQGRKRIREARSLEGSSRRALDFQADGQWGKALEELKALLVLYPQSVAVLYQLAKDYEARGEPEVSDQIRERILRDFKGQGLRELRRRRNSAMEAGDWKVATRLQDKIDSLLAGDAGEAGNREGEFRTGLNYQRGVEYLKSGRLDEAEELFTDILDAEPRFVPALIMLGEARLLRSQEQAALAVWKGGFEGTGSPTLLQRIEDFFIEKGLPREAIETLHELIGSTDNDLLPRFFLGRLYYRLEMHEEAFKVLDGLRERIQNSPTYHYLLARIHERRGEMHKAVESYSASAYEAGIAVAEYICSACHESYKNWEARCDKCGAWNSVDLDFKEEKISAEDLGVKPAAVWAAPEDEFDFDQH
jgi:tetratricopeptide (TPR) repeat protein